MIIHVVMLYICIYGACSFPSNYGPRESDEKMVVNAMENPDLYQGDILLNPRMRFGNAIEEALWPNRTIPYDLRYLRGEIRETVKLAMKYISSKTCIRFKQRTTERNYVRYTMGDGCYSYAGNIQDGGQELSLGRGCHHYGTVLHEIMHAIGFFHHHMRNDRDEHLRIHWNNISPKFHSQFYRLQPHEGRIFAPFDFESIMLYGPRTFSRDGYSKTMSAKDPRVTFYGPHLKTKLSKYDIVSINKLYGCDY